MNLSISNKRREFQLIKYDEKNGVIKIKEDSYIILFRNKNIIFLHIIYWCYIYKLYKKYVKYSYKNTLYFTPLL